MPRARAGFVGLGLVLVIAGAACRSTPAPRVPEAREFRFPHAEAAHAGLGCTVCHAAEDVQAGRPARPGKADHAPCDGSGCHAEAFTGQPSALCDLCHDEVAPWQAGGTTPAPFPPRGRERALPADFAHDRHLDKARLDAESGFHVACDDCHARDPEGVDLGLPGHAACARCHQATSPRPVRPLLDDCTGCHDPRARPAARARVLIRGDLRFSHARHETDQRGQGIACVTCHPTVGRQERAAERSTPDTQACVACHDDGKRVPETHAMTRCATCHDAQAGQVFGLVAPRSHLPPRDRPDSHTLAFRKDHGADARREPASCARCHTGVSGLRDGCDECHQVMRPQDHLPSWNEFGHGTDAAADARRCATCHAGDFCTTCHSRPPRSHQPLAGGAWTSGTGGGEPGHARLARLNLRACLTCHDYRVDCFGCHSDWSP